MQYLEILIDNKLTWKNRTQFVVGKVCIAKDIMSKLRYFVLESVLKVYFGIVYLHLQHGKTSLEKLLQKYIDRIQVQQNYIIEIVTGFSFFRTKLAPIFHELHFWRCRNLYSNLKQNFYLAPLKTTST